MSGAELAQVIDRRLFWAGMLSNGSGAVVVFVFLAFLNPNPASLGQEQIEELTVLNLAVFVPFMVIGLVLGAVRARRRFRRLSAWLREERPPTDAERGVALRYPLDPLVSTSAVGWGVAAIVFAGVNLATSSQVAVTVALTILLGGLTTCAVGYLVAERILRPLTERALAGASPDRPVGLGVATRLSMAWVLGTGVPLLGVLATAIAELGGADLFEDDAHALARTAVFLGGIALLIGVVAIRLAARSVSDPLGALRTAMSRVERGELESRVAVDDASEVGLLEAGFNRMAAGLEERERMRDLFGRHVGREVAAAALESEIELGGEEREVAALFVDLVGSTALAAERPATEVVALLNDFFRVVVQATEAHDGMVNKFEGDAALCVFGAPVLAPDPAGDALAAAREMRDRLRAEVEEVDLGIGVSAGIAVAGNVGAEERFEYTVIGDPINEAARLCDLAKQRSERLLASEAALERADREEAARWSLGEAVTLRGRAAETRLATPA